MFRKLWLGMYPLSVAFWLFGFVGYWIIAIASFLLLWLPLRRAGHTELAVVFGTLLIIGYALFSMVGIWRSATVFRGRPLWGVLARASVVIFATDIAVHLIRGWAEYISGGVPGSS